METKIDKLKSLGIPVIESLCDEESGRYVYDSMTPEQFEIAYEVVTGTYGLPKEPEPPSIEDRLAAAEELISMLLEAGG